MELLSVEVHVGMMLQVLFSSLVQDCGGKACFNLKEMDLNTGEYMCNKPFIIENDFALNCSGLTSDPVSDCCTATTHKSSYCQYFAYLTLECPILCQTSPHCGGKACFNLKEMDLNTGEYMCNKPFIIENDFALNCSGLTSDPVSDCCTATTHKSSYCQYFAYLTLECPILCQTSPHAYNAEGLVTETSMASCPSGTESSSTSSYGLSPASTAKRYGGSTADKSTALSCLSGVIWIVAALYLSL